MRRRIAATCLGAALALMLTAVPVAAHPVTGTAWGSNEDTLCRGCAVSQGNIVGFWQSVLWSDGFLNRCGATGVDGIFGNATHNATRAWQAEFGVGADGIVGPRTWGRADDFVIAVGSTGYRYVGYNALIRFILVQGNVAFEPPAVLGSGSFYSTGHPGITFARC